MKDEEILIRLKKLTEQVSKVHSQVVSSGMRIHLFRFAELAKLNKQIEHLMSDVWIRELVNKAEVMPPKGE